MRPLGTLSQDRVEASALVPRSVARGEVGRIEAVLARRGGMARALAKFSAGRDELLPAPARELAAPLARNTVLELTLECVQADLVTPKLQRLQWTGALLAPNAPLRTAVTALAPGATTAPPAATAEPAAEPAPRRAARYAWALLLARIYEVLPLVCPECASDYVCSS